jgi:hypothetical protein
VVSLLSGPVLRYPSELFAVGVQKAGEMGVFPVKKYLK